MYDKWKYLYNAYSSSADFINLVQTLEYLQPCTAHHGELHNCPGLEQLPCWYWITIIIPFYRTSLIILNHQHSYLWDWLKRGFPPPFKFIHIVSLLLKHVNLIITIAPKDDNKNDNATVKQALSFKWNLLHFRVVSVVASKPDYMFAQSLDQ